MEIIPHRGTFVTRFTSASIHDLFELRRAVEPRVAELASQRRSLSSLKCLQATLSWNSSGSNQTRSQTKWVDKKFHVELSRLTHNRELADVVERLHEKFVRLVAFVSLARSDGYPFQPLHEEIVRAVRDGAAWQARGAMEKDISDNLRWIENLRP